MLDGRYGNLISRSLLVVALGAGGCVSKSTDVVGSIDSENEVPTTPAPQDETEDPEVPVDEEPEPGTNETPGTPETPERPVLTGCSGPTPSPRCAADPQEFEAYGAASIISTFELLGDASCCTDFDEDGAPDNALGEGFAAIDKLELLNQEMRSSLLDGSQTIVLELDGLDDAENDEDLRVHVWNAQRFDDSIRGGTSHEVALDSSSIDKGVAPLFSFDRATVRDGVLNAAKGEMALMASFNGVFIQPRVRDVEVSATLESTDLATGVALRDGAVGGRVELSEIRQQLNVVAANCDCLELQGPLVDDHPDHEPGVCAKPDVSACEAEGRELCMGLVEVCPVLDVIATNLADVDGDGDGLADSISLGALFEAERAIINGVNAAP